MDILLELPCDTWHDEDDTLMMRLRDGDGTAFEALVSRHQGPLIGFFNRQLRDWQLAEDLCQEMLVKIYNTAESYLPQNMFKAWLYRAARNLLIDTKRRQKKDVMKHCVHQSRDEDREDMISRLADELPLPIANMDHAELARQVDNALDDIPDDQRMTFILYTYAGLNLPEISEIMETNLATTKSRLRLAREKMREKLAVRGFTPDQLVAV